MLKSSPATLQHKAASAQTDRRGPPSLLALLRPRFFGLAASFFLAFVVLWAVTYESPVPLPTFISAGADRLAPSREEQRPLEHPNKVLYPAEITPKYHDEDMAGKASLRTVVVQALAGKDKNTATVIFAHGLGDTGHGWTFLAEQLRPRFPYIKFIFPHAPSIPITLNGGMKMPGWFDILTLRAPRPGDPPGKEDEAGMLKSVSEIKEIVDSEVSSGMAEGRILVGGFSQGGALTYLTALTTDRKLAGVIALSAWLPMSHKATELLKSGNEGVRFFHGHGKSDQVVNYAWGDASVKSLKEQLKFSNVEFKSYAGLAHSANEEELEDIAQFIEKVLPPFAIMQRRNVSSQAERETILHHPAPLHPVNPRNLHSSPPPGMMSTSQQPVANARASSDYQRFSSPSAPTSKQQQQQSYTNGSSSNTGPPQDYQRFSSPPVNAQQQAQAAGMNMFAGGSGGHASGPQAGQAYGNMGTAGGAQQSQYRGQPQQQQQQQMPWGQFGMMNDATTQMGVQFGKSAVAAGQDYVNKNITRHLPVQHLLHSFNVSNSYVVHKLRLVLFPWLHRPWSRLPQRNETSGQVEGYKPPRDDINSPDMYIPVMALVTYILLAGVVTGTRGEFHPDDLGLTASRSLGIIFVEFMMIKLGTYLLAIGGEGTVVDLFSYSGYKFVGIIVTLFLQLFSVRGWLYWSIFVYVFCANAFFLLRSLRYVVLPDPNLQGAFSDTSGAPATTTVSHVQRSRRIKFLFFIAVSQVASMWYLIRV